MQSRAHCLMQIRPTPICSPLKSAHPLLTLPCKTFVRLKPRFIPVKELQEKEKLLFFRLQKLLSTSLFTSSGSSGGSATGKRVKFGLRLPSCISMTACIVATSRERETPPAPSPPRLGKCKRMLHGCKRTKQHRHTTTHASINQCSHNAVQLQTNRQECTLTHTEKKNPTQTQLLQHNQIRSVQWCRLNGGQTMGALWHLNRAR